ncbi:MAG: tRNA dihydrouridine synthase DusB [Clostridiaceae bacterium]|nr:tRNA dihydrouridine synthase DusB [Clostridiaceae bacterium]
MRIGSVELENNVFLAPMAGITDMPFRVLCREQGCGLMYTEMVSAKGISYGDAKSFRLAEIRGEEKPAAVQIFGSDPFIMAKVAEKLNDSKADIIDINMGCPTPKITKNGEGCALMLDINLAGSIIRDVARASEKPVTVKLRKGWDSSHVNVVELAKVAEENGAKAVAVHGRTRDMFYSGKADWDIIARVKKAVSIPVIGNGDVFTPRDAKKMLESTKCDAIMIGRGAQGNPWIFRNVLHYLKTGEILPGPSNEEKLRMIIRHMDMLIGQKGEFIGAREMRKHIAWYIKGMRNATRVKQEIFRLSSKNEIIGVLKRYLIEETSEETVNKQL